MSSRRLYLSNDKVIGGVCGGVANYLGIDPTIIRILWAFAFFVNGIGLLAYIIALLIIPADSNRGGAEIITGDMVGRVRETFDRVVDNSNSGANNSNRTFGIILVVVGAFFLLNTVVPSFPWRIMWPVAIIVVGIILISRGVGDR